MLILARGDVHVFEDIHGRNVLADFPARLSVVTTEAKASYFRNLGDHVNVELLNWSDTADIFKLVETLHVRDPLDAVAVLDETAIGLAAELRERFGIPGLTAEQAANFREKPKMKRLLEAAGVRVPQHVMATDETAVQKLLARYGRIVIKPIDGVGSRNVTFIDTSDDLQSWYAKHRCGDGFQAEEFIEGVLYHVNAVVRDGLPLVTASGPFLPGMANIDFKSGSPFASVILDEGNLKHKLDEFSLKVIQVLGMKNGVTHMECFLTGSDEIVFCEIAARPGGGGIVGMIEAHYGINYAKAALLLEAGLGHLLDAAPKRSGKVAGLIGFRLSTSGFIRRIASPQSFKDKWIIQVRIDGRPGDFVAAASHCTDFVGGFIFTADDCTQYEAHRIELTMRFNSALELNPV